MDSRAVRSVAIVLFLVAIWNAFSGVLTVSYANTMQGFGDGPGTGPGGSVILAAVLILCLLMVVGAVVLFVFARRDPRPWWMKALTGAGIAFIAVSIAGYFAVSIGGSLLSVHLG